MRNGRILGYGWRTSHKTPKCDLGREAETHDVGTPPEIVASYGHARSDRTRLRGRTPQRGRGQKTAYHRSDRLQMAGTLSCAPVGRTPGRAAAGAPRSITDARVEEVITNTLESMPDHSTHWSSRLMARKAGLSQTAIVRIWHAFGLQPHRVENFKFSKDPQFVERCGTLLGCI